MRVFGNWNDHQAYPYKLITAATVTPVSLDDVKDYLKLDSSDTSEDTLITMMIEAATDYAEKYTRRDFVNKTYLTYRNSFSDLIELRRSKLQSITHIKYYDTTGTLTTISSAIYGITDEVDYGSIYVNPLQAWPSGGLYEVPQPIQITFVSGYGAAGSNVPSALRNALLQHLAALYETRGDCSVGGGCDCEGTLPGTARSIYNIYKIKDIIGR